MQQNLSELIQDLKVVEQLGPKDPLISSVQFDSRKVDDGDIFVAVRGTQVDGHKFIQNVIDCGASVVVCEKLPEKLSPRVTYVKVENSSHALGELAQAHFGHPSRKMIVVGITGTNGKTTTATLLYSLFNRLGHRSGLLSTIQNYVLDEIVASTHTTGDAIQIASLLARMVEKDCTHCFMEVTSHALHQNRVSGMQFAGAIFTNLTQDHLDYHGTMDEYARVKKGLFDGLSDSAFALVNLDDPAGLEMVKDTRAQVHTYGTTSSANFHLNVDSLDVKGLRGELNSVPIRSPMIGGFNAYNITAATGASVLLGTDIQNTCKAIGELPQVEGRMQVISKPGLTAVVDFAHTPDALKQVLITLRELHPDSEIITVVGCGGDREKEKRPLMGEIAARFSNRVILTSDNPRSEDPADIAQAMIAGINELDATKVSIALNREEAIKTACREVTNEAIVLIAGKGHEKFQEQLGTKVPFDDVEVVKQVIGK